MQQHRAAAHKASLSGVGANLAGGALSTVQMAIKAASAAGSASLLIPGAGAVTKGIIAMVSGGINTIFKWVNGHVEGAIAKMPLKYHGKIADAIAKDQWDVVLEGAKDYVAYDGINIRIADKCGKLVSAAGLPWWLHSALTGQIAYQIAISNPGYTGYNTWHASITALTGITNYGDKRLAGGGSAPNLIPWLVGIFAKREAAGYHTEEPLLSYSEDASQWATAKPTSTAKLVGGGAAATASPVVSTGIGLGVLWFVAKLLLKKAM